MTSFDVDDAEPTHAKAEIAIDEIALIIGPPMDEAVTLASYDCSFDRAASPSIPAGNSAHPVFLARPMDGRLSVDSEVPPMKDSLRILHVAPFAEAERNASINLFCAGATFNYSGPMRASAPEVRLIRPGREALAPALGIPRHRHEYGYIAVVLAGGYEEAGLSGRLRLRAGDVVVHRAFDSHLDRVASGGASVLNLPLPAGVALPPAFRIADPDSLARIAEHDPHAASQSLEADGAVERASDWPDDLAAELEAGSEVALQEWARSRCLAAETISRGFRNAYGVTPAAFRVEVRAHRAFELVRQGATSLAAIAADCGFADQPHLTRAIVRLTGKPPGSWRRASNPFKTGARCGP